MNVIKVPSMVLIGAIIDDLGRTNEISLFTTGKTKVCAGKIKKVVDRHQHFDIFNFPASSQIECSPSKIDGIKSA